MNSHQRDEAKMIADSIAPLYQRIVELEAENARLKEELAHQHWRVIEHDDWCHHKRRAEKAEAQLAQRDALLREALANPISLTFRAKLVAALEEDKGND